MIEFIIEAAAASTAFTVLYLIFLARSSDLELKRVYLIVVTTLAMVVPLLQISVSPTNLSQLIAETSQGFLLEPVATGATNPSELHFMESTPVNALTVVYVVGVILGTLVLLFSFLKLLIQGYRSTKKRINGILVLQSPNTEHSFSFFQWVFSNDDHPAILAHEQAHICLGHTYDLILFNINRILFWWNPISWWLLKEIKLIHEFQADQIAAESQDESEYRKLLIKTTLASHGLMPTGINWNLANSFHDGAIFKRLNAMKNTNKRTSKFKISMLGMLTALVVFAFACTQDMQEISENIVESGDISVSAQELIRKLEAENPDASFKVVELHMKDGEDITDLKRKIHEMNFDEGLVEAFNLDKDKGIHEIILRDGDKLEHLAKMGQDGTYTIVEQLPEFPGGKEEMYSYVASNLIYPKEARKAGVRGKVYVQFVVDKTGQVKDVKALKGIGGGCDEAAVEIVRSFPTFTPGKVDDEAVNTKMVLPIIFSLNKSAVDDDLVDLKFESKDTEH